MKIYHRNQERVAFVNFTNCEDARRARHAKTGLVWEKMQVLLEPYVLFQFLSVNSIDFSRVYYRKSVPAEQPIKPSTSPYERSSPPRRSRRATPPSPSPPPSTTSRSHSYHKSSSSSSRYPRTNSPIRSSRPPRPPRRPYSPYIPLPPDLVDYANKGPSRQRQRSSPSPVRQHKQSSRQKRSRSANGDRSMSRSSTTSSQQASSDQEPTRTLLVGNLERDISESKLKELFARYGTIEDSMQ